MTFDEFKEGIKILQDVFEKEYKPETLTLIFERIKDRTREDWMRTCEMLVRESDRLPAAWKIIQTFPATVDIEKADFEPRQFYWDYLNAKHAEYERVVGESFETFLKLTCGRKRLATLYFSKAYWNRMGVTKYDSVYDAMIEVEESGRQSDLIFNAKVRTPEEVLEGLKSFYRKNGYIANRWYWKRFWPKELQQAELSDAVPSGGGAAPF